MQRPLCAKARGPHEGGHARARHRSAEAEGAADALGKAPGKRASKHKVSATCPSAMPRNEMRYARCEPINVPKSLLLHRHGLPRMACSMRRGRTRLIGIEPHSDGFAQTWHVMWQSWRNPGQEQQSKPHHMWSISGNFGRNSTNIADAADVSPKLQSIDLHPRICMDFCPDR